MSRLVLPPLLLLTLVLMVLFLSGRGVWAKVDLVTLPERQSSQLTIYNAADLTLARDRRELTLKQGLNHLQFSWANTLIDPTSLELLPLAHAGQVDIAELSFPPRTAGLGVWQIDSETTGSVPMEITCFTSGLSWRAFYRGFLTDDEKTMRLESYVVVSNRSGEDYENASVRLVVGRVHLLDAIAELARRRDPFGRPEGDIRDADSWSRGSEIMLGRNAGDMEGLAGSARYRHEAKRILKQGLSEYQLYSIEGTETIPDGWSKRLPSFQAEEIPVENLYHYDEQRWGHQVMRFISFANDEKHHLGATPLPEGTLMLYRAVDDDRHLSFQGRASLQYIPVDQEVELPLGPARHVIVEPRIMDYHTDRYLFDNDGDIIGWDETFDVRIDIHNGRAVPILAHITRHVNNPSWQIEEDNDYVKRERIDKDTFRFTLYVDTHNSKTINYRLTIHHGRRAR